MPKAQILVVEDENIVAKDLQQRLVALGYHIAGVASSGKEALQKAEETTPSLVLMDIRLKGAMDGVETAEELRRRFSIPVVYLTAYADNHTLQRAKVTEPFGYILKPFEERELHTCIEVALYKYDMERKLRESEQWLSTTLRCIGDGVMATDSSGRVKFLNPVAERLTGWKQADAIERDLSEVFHLLTHDELLHIPVQQIIREGKAGERPTEAILLSKDTSGTSIECRAAPIRGDGDDTAAGVVLVFRDTTERKQAEDKLRYLSTHDALTDLYNRAYFEQALVKLEQDGQFPVSIIIGDIDHFKNMNDLHGHAEGDRLLREAAQVIKGAFRAADMVMRIGGDEFAVLLPMTDAATASEAVARIRHGLAAYNAAHPACPLMISLGVATGNAGPLSEVVKEADHRMYQEKLQGRRTHSSL